jgi:predicted nucleotidyltransferase component of viral defense system
VRYENAAGFRQALERRLLDRSRENGESLVRLRKTVVFERLLARLTVAAPGRWVLKGALALDFRFGEHGRTTKDADLVRRDDEESATVDLLAAQAVDLGDFFVFSSEKVGRPEDALGGAVRYRVRAELAGRLFEEVLLDVGFSDPLGWQPERLRAPDLLSFAGIAPAEVPVLPLEQQVAEKVHAYTRRYGRGQPSTRVKDLVDLVLVKRSMTLEAARLREALEVTFDRRGGPPLPLRLPPPPSEWAVSYRKHAADVGIDADVGVGHTHASALLDPVLEGLSEGRWDPNRGEWT